MNSLTGALRCSPGIDREAHDRAPATFRCVQLLPDLLPERGLEHGVLGRTIGSSDEAHVERAKQRREGDA